MARSGSPSSGAGSAAGTGHRQEAGDASTRSSAASTLGVAGAGTMGSGIAQVALQAGLRVILYDPLEGARARGVERIVEGLRRAAARGRLSEDPDRVRERLQATDSLQALAQAGFVVEAAPEDLTLKEALFRDLGTVLGPDTIVASNTSSLPIARLAAATGRPDRALGLHFFNPVPAMALVEVIPGPDTSAATLERALALVRALGKTPVVGRDVPGFIVNRLARPFYLEALRLVGEGVATPAQVDRCLRAAGFRMGPFELMDLIGVDVNYAVSRSVYEQLHGEPRLRPHPLQASMVHAGRLGRKTGRGFYDYAEGGPDAGMAGGVAGAGVTEVPEEPAGASEPPGPVLVVVSEPEEAGPLAERLSRAGLPVWVEAVAPPGSRNPGAPVLSGRAEAAAREARVAFDLTWLGQSERRQLASALDRLLPPGAPLIASVATATATDLAAACQRPERLAGLGGFPPHGSADILELVLPVKAVGTEPGEPPEPVRRAVSLARGLGFTPVLVGDGAAGVSARVLACLVNEAAHALMERVASPADMDRAMRLGANWPEGPLELARRLGPARVLAVLSHLSADLGPDRYHPAPLLRRWAAAGAVVAPAPPALADGGPAGQGT